MAELADRPPKDAIVAGLQTKSDKIRQLARAGYSRTEIADFLGIRYQFVRNVLVNDERVAGGGKRSPGSTDAAAQDERKASELDHLYPIKTKVEQDWRVTIPQAYWRAVGLKENASVMISVEGDVLELRSLPASIRRAQELVRRIVPEGVSLVDELLAERREEARREDGDG